jgi:hypothetical protein
MFLTLPREKSWPRAIAPKRFEPEKGLQTKIALQIQTLVSLIFSWFLSFCFFVVIYSIVVF